MLTTHWHLSAVPRRLDSSSNSDGGVTGSSTTVEVPTELEAAWLEPDGTAFAYVRSTVAALQAE